MGNLMGDDHVAQDIAHLPVRNDEGAGSNVKGCGLGVGLKRNKDVFGGECFGEKRGGGVHGVPMVRDQGEKVNPLSVPPVDFFLPGGHLASNRGRGRCLAERRQVEPILIDRTLALLDDPSGDALHVDGLGNHKEIGLLELVQAKPVLLCELLGGLNETITLVEVWHCCSSLWVRW